MRKLYGILLAFLLCARIGICSTQVQAAEAAVLELQGVESGDEVNIYQIASYSGEETYVWQSAVEEWLGELDNSYQYLQPSDLSEMLSESAEEFCGLLTAAMGGGIYEVLTSGTLTGNTSYSKSLQPGYYIILPKGETRVYCMKWLCLAPGETASVAYEESDYSLPELTVTACVQTDGDETDEDETDGDETDGDETDEDETDGDDGLLWTAAEDVLAVELEIILPEYPAYYAQVKQINSICVVIPEGFAPQEEVGLWTVDGTDETEEALDEDTDYAIQCLSDAVAYRTEDGGELLFFGGSDGWFYAVDGSTLQNEGLEQALALYNDENGTEYTEEELTEESCCTLILSLDTGQEYSALKLTYEAEKDYATSEDGLYELEHIFVYSTDAVGQAVRARQTCSVAAASYGIHITVCDGESVASAGGTTVIPEDAVRLSGAIYTVYALEAEFALPDEEEELEQEKSALGEGNYYVIYGQDGDSAKIYRQLTSVETDGLGTCSMGGVPAEECLVVETIFPEGYSLSRAALVIEEDDWTSDIVMEGNYICDVLWLDYKGVSLPQTGGMGTLPLTAAGLALMCAAVAGMIFRRKSSAGKRILKA